MLQRVKRKVALGIGVLAVGVLAVACSGAPQFGSTTAGFQASVGGFSFQLPSLTLPFVSPGPKQANPQAVTTAHSTSQGASFTGGGCPLDLPQ
jgi:hypothetical protein